MDKKYLEQIKRTERWYERFEKIYLDTKKRYDNLYYEDVIYAFFQNCYHLKDWLKNSNVIEEKRLNNFIDTNEDMKICRDLCNASKHLVLKSGKDLKLMKLDLPLKTMKGYSHNSNYYCIKEVGGGVHSAFDVAVRCLVSWRNFLKTEKIKKSFFQEEIS
jgi:hypothetical protein